jgi:serum/glucocorticoid-regulated kinase 2
VIGAEGLSLPAGTPVPGAVDAALSSQAAKLAEAISPSSVTQQRLAHKSRGSRESVQRVGIWFLPYLVVGYEVNQTVITPVGGSLARPTYAYPAHFDVTVQEEVAVYAYVPRRRQVRAEPRPDGLRGRVVRVRERDRPHPGLSTLSGVRAAADGRQIGWSFQAANKSLTIDDFELITVIGKGSFGKVCRLMLTGEPPLTHQHRSCKSKSRTRAGSTR